MTMQIKTLEETAALKAVLETACAAHRAAVSETVTAAGGLLAAARDLTAKGTAPVVIEESFDTFSAALDGLRAAVGLLNDRHALVALLLDALRAHQAGPRGEPA